MKKIKFFVASSLLSILTAGIISCSSNEEITNATPEVTLPESAKSPEVIAFREAFIKDIKAKSQLNKTENKSEANAKADTEIKEASITFLQANGISLSEIQSKEANDPSEIRRMAIALFAKKTAINSNN